MLRENAISRYLHNALGSLPSPFAQLVFLASLRDPYTGHYFHEGWASVSSPGDVNTALRETHRTVFDSVVGLSLITLTRELRNHFESLGEAELRAAKLWLQTEPFHEMIPEGCPTLSRKFFVSQLRLALEVLVQAPSWAYLEAPASSPSPQPAPQPQPHWLN
jgi:hypothetical protein